MRKTMALVMITATLATVAAVEAQGRRGGNRAGSCMRLTDAPAVALGAEEAAGLAFTREEEKLARDVYTALHETWQTASFLQIAAAEQRHMDAIGRLLERYGVADPVGSNAAGVFTEPRLAALYTELVSKGRLSLADALTVGATIEDLDLADLGRLQDATENPELDLVYGNLARGSGNHLRSFVGQLAATGGSYAPQYLTAEAYQAVIAATAENGRGMRRGRALRGQGGAVAGPGTGVCDGTGPGGGAGQGNGRGNGQGNGQGNGRGNGGGNGGSGGPGTPACDGSGRP